MNTKEAIAQLTKSGIKVDRVSKNKFRVWDVRGDVRVKYNYKTWDTKEFWTGREIVDLASVFSSENKQNTTMKKNIKKFDKSKNRRETRDLISKEDFDKIPQNKKTKTEDPWIWD